MLQTDFSNSIEHYNRPNRARLYPIKNWENQRIENQARALYYTKNLMRVILHCVQSSQQAMVGIAHESSTAFCSVRLCVLLCSVGRLCFALVCYSVLFSALLCCAVLGSARIAVCTPCTVCVVRYSAQRILDTQTLSNTNHLYVIRCDCRIYTAIRTRNSQNFFAVRFSFRLFLSLFCFFITQPTAAETAYNACYHTENFCVQFTM